VSKRVLEEALRAPAAFSTTELTRHINGLAREHSTNWHRIGTGLFATI